MTLFEPVFVAKLATVVINAGLFALLTAFLLHFRIRWWWVFLLILLVTNPFLFRINLVKAPGISLILLVLGLWLLFERRTWQLAILGFVYVWTYGGFILLGVFGTFATIAFLLTNQYRRHTVLSFFRRFYRPRFRWRRFVWNSHLLPLYAIAIGIVAGLVLNPYFPKNLVFYWQQLVEIGIVNFQKVVNVGGEWHPYGFVALIANTVFVSIAVLCALVTFLITRKRQSAESWTLLAIFVFCLCITLKSRRYVELYVPFATLFAAFALRDGVREPVRDIARKIFHLLGKRVVLVALLGVYIVGVGLMVVVRDNRQVISDLRWDFLQISLRVQARGSQHIHQREVLSSKVTGMSSQCCSTTIRTTPISSVWTDFHV